MKRFLATAVVCMLACASPSYGSEPSSDTALAARTIAEARAACRREGGRLWGVRLDGPVLFVNPATRAVIASEPDREGRLVPRDGVFVGALPANVPVANTSIEWAGVTWAMVLWPLPEDARERTSLVVHELFHRAQEQLGLPKATPANAHLDTVDGRVLLQLEWRALGAAIGARGAARRGAVEDALAFRAARRAGAPEAAVEERALELNEGTAEDTAIAAVSPTAAERRRAVLALIDRAAARPSFVRSFAYVSGPAYGVLLDEAGARWRRGLGARSDLGELLGARLRIPVGARHDVEARAARYGGAELRSAEEAREHERLERVATLRARLVDGPVLTLPIERIQVSFDPNALVPLGEAGTVYPTMTASDAWGTLTVTNGALLSPSWTTITVTAPADASARRLSGDGWTLDLAPGWAAVPATRAGSYALTQTQNRER